MFLFFLPDDLSHFSSWFFFHQLDGVKQEISSIVGLPEIKKQLGSILEKIIDAEKDAADGLRVIPPKPFHMVFVGRNGTGAFQNHIQSWFLKVCVISY